METRKSARLAVAVLVCVAGAASAQQDESEAVGDPAVVEARALLQAGRKEIIADEIRFTREEGRAFWAAYEEYRRDITAVRDRQAALVAEYLEAYRAATVSEELATSLVDDYLDIKQELLKVQRRHLKKFRRVLPPRKVGRFYQLESKLDAELEAQLALFVPLMDPV